MTEPKKSFENPLKILFGLESLVDGSPLNSEVFSDTAKLYDAVQEKVKSQADISARDEVKGLLMMLEIATGKKDEHYYGQAQRARETINGLVRDYRALALDGTALQTAYAGALADEIGELRVGLYRLENYSDGLMEMVNNRQKVIDRFLDERINIPFGGLQSFFSFIPSVREGIAAQLGPLVNKHIEDAKRYAGENIDVYRRVIGALGEARAIAAQYQINFDRVFSSQIGQIVETYITQRIISASKEIKHLNVSVFLHQEEDGVTKELGLAQTAAHDFKLESKYKERIQQVARQFVDAAIEASDQSHTQLTNKNDYLRLANRINQKYDLKMNIPA